MSYAKNARHPPSADEIHHALLRPAILQILRAQGYYSSTPATVDAVTELAANYCTAISRSTAQHAALNNEVGSPSVPDIVDVRLAFEELGVLWPERDFTSQELKGEEDMRGVNEFIRWAKGKKNQRIRKVAALDKPAAGDVVEGVEEQRDTNYLSALKRKHNKTDQDSKYAGTILGKGLVEAENSTEDDDETNIHAWARKMHESALRPPEPEAVDIESRPPSSGLSSLADEDVAMMDIEF
ncbi:hypothetical protein GGS26DRAFT_554685 [Hypomontagnella submonticulosa]|nr:hypothetical protein GGS26DRAFT_554685 [Hypomontagnella submonticulosa]